MADPLEQMQGDIVGRILSDATFAEVHVFDESLGTTEGEMEAARGPRMVRSGKKQGAAIYVALPEDEVQYPDMPGPESQAEVMVRIIEFPKINRAAGGTQLTATQILTRCKRLLHLWSRGGRMLQVKRSRRYNDGEGAVGFDLFVGEPIGLQPPAAVAGVDLEGTAAAVTLSCDTEDADIWYTTDGSYPHADGPSSAQYSAPVAVAAGTTVRAVAYKSGLAASDLNEAAF